MSFIEDSLLDDEIVKTRRAVLRIQVWMMTSKRSEQSSCSDEQRGGSGGPRLVVMSQGVVAMSRLVGCSAEPAAVAVRHIVEVKS